MLVQLGVVAPSVLGNSAHQSLVPTEVPVGLPTSVLRVKGVPFRLEMVGGLDKIIVLIEPVSHSLKVNIGLFEDLLLICSDRACFVLLAYKAINYI